MTSVYLAGPFSWRDRLARVADALADLGIATTSRWMTAHAEHGDDMKAYSAAELTRYGLDDFEDIDKADAVVLFNPIGSAGGGGRWVELGYALKQQKLVLMVGPQTNPFCFLTRWLGDMHTVMQEVDLGVDEAVLMVAELIKGNLPRADA